MLRVVWPKPQSSGAKKIVLCEIERVSVGLAFECPAGLKKALFVVVNLYETQQLCKDTLFYQQIKVFREMRCRVILFT